MSRRFRFSEHEKPNEAPPKKRKRRKQAGAYYTGEAGGAQTGASSGGTQAGPAEAPEGGTASSTHKIGELEQKSARYKERLEDAKGTLPTKKKAVRKRIYDEQKGKAKSKYTFESQTVPIHEADWNISRQKTIPQKLAGVATRKVITKAHAIVHRVEHENVGVKAAHRGELLGESAYRGGKRTVQKAYRFHKNRPYRKIAKFEAKSIKTEAKLGYQRALQNAPKKKNAISRYFQRRRIKRQYAASFRKAKQSGKVTKHSVGIVGRAGRVVTGIIRRNPIVLGKMTLLGLLIILFMGMVSMCMSMFSGGSAFFSAVTYVADYADIDEAEIAYGEWTVDLQIYLWSIEQNHAGFDEYRYDVGQINHNPLSSWPFSRRSMVTLPLQKLNLPCVDCSPSSTGLRLHPKWRFVPA